MRSWRSRSRPPRLDILMVSTHAVLAGHRQSALQAAVLLLGPVLAGTPELIKQSMKGQESSYGCAGHAKQAALTAKKSAEHSKKMMV